MPTKNRRFTFWRVCLLILLPVAAAVGIQQHSARAQNKEPFPDGYDAVVAAPKSHKVVFENALVRVLEVTIPAPGTTEPMHHHSWPGFFLSWDTGGTSPHVRYHRGDGTVSDQPSRITPSHPGAWSIHGMKPEAMHAIEVLGDGKSSAGNKDTNRLCFGWKSSASVTKENIECYFPEHCEWSASSFCLALC
jgi:hypothetical protein